MFRMKGLDALKTDIRHLGLKIKGEKLILFFIDYIDKNGQFMSKELCSHVFF